MLYLLFIIGGAMVSMLASSAGDGGFQSSCQTKDNRIDFCSFSSIKHTDSMSNSKHWLAQNQNNVPEWSDMSNCRLLLQ